MVEGQSCTNPSCFFCIMKDADPSHRKARIASCFKEMPLRDSQDDVLVMSGIWNIAMNQPDDPEFPSLGIFTCMASMINKGIKNRSWLLKDQNIYIPYYAAHVIGSYTMNKAEFAQKAIESGVIPPLVELLRGKISWVEQRVAVRALGHVASYEKTFEAVMVYEEEVVKLAMQIASTCLDVVHTNFVGVQDENKRLKYHRDLLTRGLGGLEMENRKAEEWASQLQCWSLHLLNCFSCKERSISLICKQEFLEDLCEMWGGLVNHTSPAGVGLIRILCYSKNGRKSVAESKQVIKSLCNLSRSSDDWQYMAIDCLLFLLKDLGTRYQTIEIAGSFLADLVELGRLANRSNVGKAITRALLLDYTKSKLKLRMNNKVQKAIQEVWDLKVEGTKREKMMSAEKVEEKRVLVGLVKQQGNRFFLLGEMERAIDKYTEALGICPLRLRKERMVLYSNRAQCQLLLKDPDAAISDTTRALSLSNPANSHKKSLWRRSQAYDMKGLAKESLMDCIMFLNGCINNETTRRVRIPYHAARMISKQMDATWIFSAAKSKAARSQLISEAHESNGDNDDGDDRQKDDQMMRIFVEKKGVISGLTTIIEEPFTGKEMTVTKPERARRRKAVTVRST